MHEAKKNLFDNLIRIVKTHVCVLRDPQYGPRCPENREKRFCKNEDYAFNKKKNMQKRSFCKHAIKNLHKNQNILTFMRSDY